MTVRLSPANLDQVAALGVPVPGYQRGSLVPRILHLGVGGFHRAHMARYTDEIASAGSDWGIRGAGLLEADRRMAAALGAQDGLYTLIERATDGSRPQVIGSIVDYTLASGFAEHVANPQLAILSMTITEGGYGVDDGNPTIEAIVSALGGRRAAGAGPLTILSCDNLPGNGDVARAAIMNIAGDRLGDYLERCSFPNSMVDRITPQTKQEDIAWLRDEVGVEDEWPVVCEPFRQWVIEDNFVADRPRWEDAGALFTDRVHDWELYKLRMLNASHSCLAYPAALAGIVFVDEASGVPVLHSYLERFLETEAIPVLSAIPGYPPAEYAATVLDRFSNTGVRDQIARLCIDGTAKFPSFLIPTVEAQLERGGPVACSALALAAWARYLATIPEAERAPDSRGERALELARRFPDDPISFLSLDEVFTPRLQRDEVFRQEFAAAADALAEAGSLGAVRSVLSLD